MPALLTSRFPSFHSRCPAPDKKGKIGQRPYHLRRVASTPYERNNQFLMMRGLIRPVNIDNNEDVRDQPTQDAHHRRRHRRRWSNMFPDYPRQQRVACGPPATSSSQRSRYQQGPVAADKEAAITTSQYIIRLKWRGCYKNGSSRGTKGALSFSLYDTLLSYSYQNGSITFLGTPSECLGEAAGCII